MTNLFIWSVEKTLKIDKQSNQLNFVSIGESAKKLIIQINHIIIFTCLKVMYIERAIGTKMAADYDDLDENRMWADSAYAQWEKKTSFIEKIGQIHEQQKKNTTKKW